MLMAIEDTMSSSSNSSSSIVATLEAVPKPPEDFGQRSCNFRDVFLAGEPLNRVQCLVDFCVQTLHAFKVFAD
jgi:hypothetical protein